MKCRRKQKLSQADLQTRTAITTVVACIREDESIPHDEKVKFYQNVLLHYSNVLDGMCEKRDNAGELVGTCTVVTNSAITTTATISASKIETLSS